MKVMLRLTMRVGFLCYIFFAGQVAPIPSQTAGSVPPIKEHFSDELLRLMHEPRLAEASADKDAVIYRVSIFPVWGNDFVVRAEKVGSIYKLWSRELDGGDGYSHKLVRQNEVTLSAADSETLDALIKNLNFFQMPTDDGVHGLDGDGWIFEGVSGGEYYVVERWCASNYKCKQRGLEPFVALCRFLVNKSHSRTPTNKGVRLL